MKFKKLTAAVLVAAMLSVSTAAGVLPDPIGISAKADDTLTEGDWMYTIDGGDGQVILKQYIGTDKNATIPDTLGGKPVTEIGFSFFSTDTTIENIIISASVQKLPACNTAFYFLKSITVVEENENYCSENGVLFSKDKTTLVWYPSGKSGTSYTVPNTVTAIGDSAFIGAGLTSVILPDGLKEIGHEAFFGCALTSIAIPGSVEKITPTCFNGCTSLESITVAEENPYFSSIGAALLSKDGTKLVALNEFDSSPCVVPECVTTISGYSLYIMRSVTIPKSVTKIESAAFSAYHSIAVINYVGTKAEWEAIEIDPFLNDWKDELSIVCTDGTINEREPETSEPDTSDTSEPTSSGTSDTTSSDTSEPTSSNTSEPTTSDTSEPTSSGTSEPTTGEILTPVTPPVITQDPTSSDTSEPTSNNTSSNTSGSSDDFKDENEVSTEVEAPSKPATVSDDDRITSITINPAFNMKNKNGDNVELDLSKISIKASEIYDEEGLQRAEEALGETLNGNKHYNLLDLTLLYDGKDFSDGYEGLVKVIIPLPNGHRDKNFSCYRLTEVNGKMEKHLIPGEQTEDSYIIYLEHFSLYALVAYESSTPNISTPDEVNNPYTGGFVTLFAPIAALAAVTVAAVAKKKK